MSVDAITSISSLSLLDTALTLASSSKTSPVPPASPSTVLSASDLRKDLSSLLSNLADGDIAAARAGLDQLESDTQIDVLPTSGQTSDVDVTSTPATSATSNTSVGTSTQFSNAVHTLIARLSSQISSGHVETAVKDLSTFITSNGHRTGNLLRTTA